MKKFLMLLVFSLLLLAVPFSLPAYDDSPSNSVVIPECIWAGASGGGTWVTEIQITSMSASATVRVSFFYDGGTTGPFNLSTDLAKYNSITYSNILNTLDSLDTSAFNYYGKVGAVWFSTTEPLIQVTAKTTNGNYGKTFPGLNATAANTAAVGRLMRIPLLVNSAIYRTFTGFFNTSSATTYNVGFSIISYTGAAVGAYFSKTFVPNDYQAFNPFAEAGIVAGTYDNCWLNIYPIGGEGPGIMCFGAIANNLSNDPSALIALPWTYL